LEVVGRRSGRAISFPLVMTVVDGERYLVSMLGSDVAWVRNLRMANGHALLRHGRTERVRLEEIPVEERSRILKVVGRLISVDSDESVGKTDSGAYSSASRRASAHPRRGESKRARDQAFRLRSSDFRQSREVIHSGRAGA
jgi:hypothetical protein